MSQDLGQFTLPHPQPRLLPRPPNFSVSGPSPQAFSLRSRSCLSCRRRKVRCDKELPCSTCWRGQVPCSYPLGKEPRGTRRTNVRQSESELVERVKALENMIEKLVDHIEVVPESNPSSTTSFTSSSLQSQTDSPGTLPGPFLGESDSSQASKENRFTKYRNAPVEAQELHHKFGRLVLHEPSGGKRYISDSLWAKLDDELSSVCPKSPQLKDDVDDCELDKADDTTTLHTSPSDHHSFILGYSSIGVDLYMYLPEPFHVPYLWSIYQENVDPLLKSVHIPTMENIFREARRNFDQLSTAYQALALAIYYGAVVSLEPKDVLSNLGQSKDEALARYRFAVQQALSRANFLTTSDITVLQAFSIFLSVMRHQDEPRFCWSLVGLAVHLARGMGLHRDGSHLALGPFERELRRRLWWGLMQLDLRSAEELGNDLIIGNSTFDTQMPSHINDIDISPGESESPQPREGRTDTTIFLVRCEICALSRQIIEATSKSSTVEEQKEMLVEVYHRIGQRFFKWIDKADPVYDMAVMLSRSIRAKICFVIYQSELFPQTGMPDDLPDEARQCLYSAAVNLLEYNHVLHTDPQVQQYRWLFQTFTNWHAMAYFLIESCRRPWTPLVERGWQALHGYQEHNTSYIESPAFESIVLPIKRLWLRASKHRAREITRLSENLEEASHLEQTEAATPVIFPFGDQLGGDDGVMDLFRARWNAMIRTDSNVMPTRILQRSPLAVSCPQILTPGTTDTEGSVDANFCKCAKCLPSWNLCQTPEYPTATSKPLHLVDRSRLGDETNRQSSDGTQAPTLDTKPQQTGLPIDHCPPPPWLGPFHPAAMGSDELETAGFDIFGDDFNWQDWARNIQGLDL